ncbi:hypothetical protein [Corallococcus sp. Z5C101001]|uniref:hypothetical protein n=1 Tax=Corallococcus sp. Z5C101001 TaxID=2596829 RepID=UPI00117D92DE|nr:hypothetical protein [Corallococcus sp. Z5C101001]TSC23562.1 hypothetical protein FOF48_28805 [Corallococcus sp. Z5C101001]
MQPERYELLDGSTPDVTPLAAEVGRKQPLSAFTLLDGGDVFEARGGRPPAEGPTRARAYVSAKLEFKPYGAPAAQVKRVQEEIARQLSGNLQLIARLEAARPLTLELIPSGHTLAKYGYPKAVSPRAAGLFWDHPDWPRARIALRQDKLDTEQYLVFHEMAHAIQGLAFTQQESELIYRTMLRTYRSRAAVDEVFAIYSEREFVAGVSAHDLRAPGVYGMARQRWNEEHLFTRFVRNLYFPYKPLAGGTAGMSPSGFG